MTKIDSPEYKIRNCFTDGDFYPSKKTLDNLDKLISHSVTIAVEKAKEEGREEAIKEAKKVIKKRMLIEKKRSENPEQSESKYISGKYIGLRYALDFVSHLTPINNLIK